MNNEIIPRGKYICILSEQDVAFLAYFLFFKNLYRIGEYHLTNSDMEVFNTCVAGGMGNSYQDNLFLRDQFHQFAPKIVLTYNYLFSR